MSRSLLKDKDFVPNDELLATILGNRWYRYKQTINKLVDRNLHPEIYWYGPSSGWAPRFCVGEVTVCGIYLAQNPLMWLIGIGDKVASHLDKDKHLTSRARALYEMTPKKGPLRWIEGQLATKGDLDAFLSLVDGKLRALFKEGVKTKDGAADYSRLKKKYLFSIEKKKSGRKSFKIKNFKEEPIQIGPPSKYSLKTLMLAGRG
jgi:hypothetical protein